MHRSPWLLAGVALLALCCAAQLAEANDDCDKNAKPIEDAEPKPYQDRKYYDDMPKMSKGDNEHQHEKGDQMNDEGNGDNEMTMPTDAKYKYQHNDDKQQAENMDAAPNKKDGNMGKEEEVEKHVYDKCFPHGYKGKIFAYAALSGLSERPTPVPSKAYGAAYVKVYGYKALVYMQFSDIDDVTQAHIHVGQREQAGLVGAWIISKDRKLLDPAISVIKGKAWVEVEITPAHLVGDTFASPDPKANWHTFLSLMHEEGLYVNVHTLAFPAGEMRGQLIASKHYDSKVCKSDDVDEIHDRMYDDWDVRTFTQSWERGQLYNRLDKSDKYTQRDKENEYFKMDDIHYAKQKDYLNEDAKK